MRPLSPSEAAALPPPSGPSRLAEVLAGHDHRQAAALLPARRWSGTKHHHGAALIISGHRRYPGATLLATRAALRSGVGRVSVVAPAAAAAALAGHAPEAVVHRPPGDFPTLSPQFLETVEPLLRAATAVLVGPGIGTDPEVANFLEGLLELPRGDAPIIIDADAINLAAQLPLDLKRLGGRLVLTPHHLEMARLLDRAPELIESARLESARELAAALGCTVALKGPSTLIVDARERVRVSPWRLSGLAKAGAGDVLAGLMAGLLAQTPERHPADAAALAVYLHGLAGAIASERQSEFAATPSDTIASLGRAFNQLAQVKM